MRLRYFIGLAGISLFQSPLLKGEDGYRLWMRYEPVREEKTLLQYRDHLQSFMVSGQDQCTHSAAMELSVALPIMLGTDIPIVSKPAKGSMLLAGTPESSVVIGQLLKEHEYSVPGDEGFLIFSAVYNGEKVIVITGSNGKGVLYGTFHFLRLLQTRQEISELYIKESPRIQLRMLNHWDNLDGTIERGYAGRSLWNWERLPAEPDPRYTDYARMMASVGLNGTVITNVNANARVLTHEYLVKAAALADIFRPYGIRVYLTARFSAPIEVGGLSTADPLDPDVRNWWKEKAGEIYALIPDFGGFLVKANSEGQPGPQNYNRSHADGATMLAGAVGPYGGVVLWRAFVYDNNVPEDRTRQAYNEFVPLDGKFPGNVIVQVKNGPLDFQPREPFHPLFGAMEHTNLGMEFQITQEYLGFSTHLVYLGNLWSECLRSDTWCKGKGSEVAGIIDGSLTGQSITAIAGVSNTGRAVNWTGHPFAQANLYAFGRLAWDHSNDPMNYAEEWAAMTFSPDSAVVSALLKIMSGSREAAVNYMTPLGLHHIMSADLHYGPGPWVDHLRADWNSTYYHRADSSGIGFDRTLKGSNAVSQYHPPVRDVFNDLAKCPENLLLWFHHVPWNYKLSSGRDVWEELCYRYHSGVDEVRRMQIQWSGLQGRIDRERFEQVAALLTEQEKNAVLWRDACLLYFSTFSGRSVPNQFEQPKYDLGYYKSIHYIFNPVKEK